MQPYIKTENLSLSLLETRNTSVRRAVMDGEIPGLSTVFHTLVRGDCFEPGPRQNEGHVFLFTGGHGIANIAGFSLGIHEIALLAPVHQRPLSITATGDVLEVLEMIISLNAEDLRELEAGRAKYPFFISYSDCKTYRERIKSPKTVSRTLLPEHTFPRLCVGSVETTGPDHVAAHQHPMLEQLFFGLHGNRCTVRADGHFAELRENVLLHVPLGSDHSVDVAAPHKLHYVWIDLFRDKSGMDWITREHIIDE